uniref:UspA domain-containing protein n=1 Tax=Arion vulgaris TaxID=1028688 RepID=A0A0B7BC18_9EUPU
MGRNVVVAVDGSSQSHYAFQWFLENMFNTGDFIVLVHVAEYNINIGLPGKAADVDEICAAVKKRNDEIGNMTDEFMNILRAKHIQAKLQILQGDKPGDLIVKAAADEGAGSIIIGTRGLGKIRRTLLGSVSEYVVHHANCAVTVVRQSE